MASFVLFLRSDAPQARLLSPLPCLLTPDSFFTIAVQNGTVEKVEKGETLFFKLFLLNGLQAKETAGRDQILGKVWQKATLETLNRVSLGWRLKRRDYSKRQARGAGGPEPVPAKAGPRPVPCVTGQASALQGTTYPTRCGRCLPCRCGGKCARRNSRAGPGADLPAGAFVGSCQCSPVTC